MGFLIQQKVKLYFNILPDTEVLKEINSFTREKTRNLEEHPDTQKKNEFYVKK